MAFELEAELGRRGWRSARAASCSARSWSAWSLKLAEQLVSAGGAGISIQREAGPPFLWLWR